VPIAISVIVPAYNSAKELSRCLESIQSQSFSPVEVLVIDDGSTDDTAAVAARMGVNLLRLPENSGSATARNRGAAEAGGEILFFVDADVVLAPEAMSRVAQCFAKHADLAALFGSYDAKPAAQNLASQYRNLLHHYVHQVGNAEAFTFWTACGAIRKPVFEALGGFDEAKTWRPIEDIELGYRLRKAGHRILLDKDLQCTHLKRWTIRSLIWTDVVYPLGFLDSGRRVFHGGRLHQSPPVRFFPPTTRSPLRDPLFPAPCPLFSLWGRWILVRVVELTAPQSEVRRLRPQGP
jgi:GT2 family glycosyltransferase